MEAGEGMFPPTVEWALASAVRPRRVAAAPASGPPVRVFVRAHQDALLLAGQPANVAPAGQLTQYRIVQHIDDRAASLSGEVVIVFQNVTGKPLSELPLVVHPNSAVELGAAPNASGRVNVTAVQRLRDAAAPERIKHKQVRPTLVKVELGAAVAPNESVTIRVVFEGKLRRLSAASNNMLTQVLGSMGSMTGSAAAADYGLLAVGDGILTAASAYPMVAPYRDGAFDTGPPAKMGDLAYNDVATFEVTTHVPRGLLLVTNLVDETPTDREDGGMTVISKGSHVRDFVLVGGRDLQRSHVEVGDTRVTSVYRAGDAEAGKRALQMAASALRSFEARFGPYPYRELDVVEASLVGGAGGVEFNSMVLIAGMLYRDPVKSDPLLGMLGNLGGAGDHLAMTLDFTVAHEVAHQYFAGIVGNDSHRFPSLDEPIAQYAAGLAIEDRYGKKKAQRAMDSLVKMNYAVYRMLGGDDKPVLRDTQSFETPTEYAALVYGKAPYVYVGLRKQLGDDVLHRAIRDAVNDHRFALATTDQWIASLEKSAGGSSLGVRLAFKRWLRQTHADADMGIDGSGDFVIDVMLPPELAEQLKQGSGGMLDPRTLIKSMLRGGP
jgi:hypothetical protein